MSVYPEHIYPERICPERICPVSDLPLSAIAQPHLWTQAFLNASAEFGLRVQSPLNHAEDNCCGLFYLTQRNARRVHTGEQLSAAIESENLGDATRVTLLRNVSVDHLQLSEGRVSQLQLTQTDIVDGTRVRIAKKLSTECEVILTAGAIGSPQILLQSGIGAAEKLEQLGIKVQHALDGVGENLQDHLVYPIVMKTKQSLGLPPSFRQADRQRYRAASAGGQAGPMGSNLAEAGALLGAQVTSRVDAQSSAQLGSHACPEIQIHFTPTHYLKYPSNRAPTDYCSMAVTDLHPRSRGRLTLSRTNLGYAPEIDPAYLNEESDKQRMVDAIEICRQIASQTALRDVVLGRSDSWQQAYRSERVAAECANLRTVDLPSRWYLSDGKRPISRGRFATAGSWDSELANRGCFGNAGSSQCQYASHHATDCSPLCSVHAELNAHRIRCSLLSRSKLVFRSSSSVRYGFSDSSRTN